MLKVVKTFLDRLAERLVVMSAGLVSSSVETLHAAGQAEQQSRLEDLARQYEADGKPEIAATLRERAGLLATTNPAQRAVPMLHNVTGCEPAEPGAAGEAPLLGERDLAALPDFSATSSKKPRRKRNTSRTDKTVE